MEKEEIIKYPWHFSDLDSINNVWHLDKVFSAPVTKAKGGPDTFSCELIVSETKIMTTLWKYTLNGSRGCYEHVSLHHTIKSLLLTWDA